MGILLLRDGPSSTVYLSNISISNALKITHLPPPTTHKRIQPPRAEKFNLRPRKRSHVLARAQQRSLGGRGQARSPCIAEGLQAVLADWPGTRGRR